MLEYRESGLTLTLSLIGGFAEDGARAYLCVQGGVDVPQVLGSKSTDIRAGMGGVEGRPLSQGDSVGRSDVEGDAPKLLHSVYDPLRSNESLFPGEGKEWELRVLPGPSDPTTGKEPVSELASLVDAEFKVLPRSDRMAVCLSLADEATVTRKGKKPIGGEQMSEACVSGTIQLPPDGNPIILLAEHQTTGGYKVPGIVAQADLWKVFRTLTLTLTLTLTSVQGGTDASW